MLPMSKKLEQLYKEFEKNLQERGPENAINNLRAKLKDSLGLEPKTATEITQKMINIYNVNRDEAQHFIQECDGLLDEYYQQGHNLLVGDKIAILEMARNTDIPTMTGMKSSLCLDVAQEAIQTGNLDLLRTACIYSDGMTPEMYEPLKANVIVTFGFDEANKIEILSKARENVYQTIEELNQDLANKKITPENYRETMETIKENLPEEYIDTYEIIQTKMTAQYIEANLQNLEQQEANYKINISNPDITIEISTDKDGSTTELTSSDFENQEQMIQFIQKNNIKSDNICDIISEVNVPPTDPTFVSELSQKLSNYISTQTSLDYEEAEKVSSILPDDQKATFLSMADDAYADRSYELETNNSYNEYEQDYDEYNDEYNEEYDNEERDDTELIL
jgi:hypothetical protein